MRVSRKQNFLWVNCEKRKKKFKSFIDGLKLKLNFIFDLKKEKQIVQTTRKAKERLKKSTVSEDSNRRSEFNQQSDFGQNQKAAANSHRTVSELTYCSDGDTESGND